MGHLEDLSLGETRRIALAAQGFDRPRPLPPIRVGISHLRRTLHRLGLVQIDYVNVLAPAQYQVLFSRLGPYDTARFDELVYRRREFTEQWAHEASILPVEHWPLLRHRMATHRVRPYGFERFLARHPAYVRRVLAQVRARGPLAADDLLPPEGVSLRIRGDAWVGTVPRAVLEAHFGRGALAVAARRPNFSRTFDLAERVIPRTHHRRRVEQADAERELLRLAARAQGVATADDLADYYRIPIRAARERLAELVAAGELRETRVEGWRQPAYLHRDARVPRGIDAAALLSPFDPVVWTRPRASRLFDFDYRLEIYVPGPKRRWGYYVLPFLLGERLVARVDLKADRDARRLLVPAAYLERGAKPGPVAEALAAELRVMAGWLGLDSVVVGRRGDLARALAAALRG
jgi:uncharacterized protein YcaQ